MNAADIMTRNVVTAGPNAQVHEIATMMVHHHIKIGRASCRERV